MKEETKADIVTDGKNTINDGNNEQYNHQQDISVNNMFCYTKIY